MTQNIFISYSRRELGFVDDLVSRLEARQYNVWLDYRVLIPGVPWAEQIEKGLHGSDTVLLVVSKAAISSDFVALEWKHFLETNKRVILLIFEAVDLPPELEKFEWVDFRSSIKAGLDELFSQLEKPIQEEHPVPETGFKASWMVWGAVILSVGVAIISLGAFWTVFIPWLLIPLPYRIFKRKFDFVQVQSALLFLPLALALSAVVYIDETLSFEENLLYGLGLGALGWLLLWILRLPSLQRWLKPEANVPRFANPKDPGRSNPQPVPFFVDYAPQDRAIAQELIAALTRYGHPQASDINSAKAVFVLISQFKSDSEAKPDQQVVFPVIVQTNNAIAKKLSRLQWIDFRPGVRGLEVIAQLLDEPRNLVKALGMRPVSALTVFPPMITALYFFVIFLSAVNLGAVVDYLLLSGILSYVPEDYLGPTTAALIINLILFSGLGWFMLRGLSSRRGLFAHFPAILVGLAVQGTLMLSYNWLDSIILEPAAEAGYDLSEIGMSFANFGDWIFFIGVFALLFVFLRNRHDTRRWFPARSPR